HPATTQLYTLSLHDALPISITSASRERGSACVMRMIRSAKALVRCFNLDAVRDSWPVILVRGDAISPDGPMIRSPDGPILSRFLDRKSTRLNSSHVKISYAV